MDASSKEEEEEEDRAFTNISLADDTGYSDPPTAARDVSYDEVTPVVVTGDGLYVPNVLTLTKLLCQFYYEEEETIVFPTTSLTFLPYQTPLIGYQLPAVDAENQVELEEKTRLINQVLELQHTLEDLSARVDAVKEENLKLKSENQVLGQYIENLMSASSVFQTTDTKSKRK
ncbi:hypothetical protein MG293_013455 [Ovis ammon polii]|uniref:Short coiled-coil protein n=1 Tax=Ovis ammon polii TaxID=230172 RepID=A0AAD4TY44_OVIAM|nr:hypothetical protein MG293_013455 [Ovis ammon polii]KAI4557180.1 hypothetical protein MJT46_013859 [Ovis ammon polii x Ovis aries]